MGDRKEPTPSPADAIKPAPPPAPPARQDPGRAIQEAGRRPSEATRRFDQVRAELASAAYVRRRPLADLRARLEWYLAGMPGVGDRQGYFDSGDLFVDLLADLQAAIALVEAAAVTPTYYGQLSDLVAGINAKINVPADCGALSGAAPTTIELVAVVRAPGGFLRELPLLTVQPDELART